MVANYIKIINKTHLAIIHLSNDTILLSLPVSVREQFNKQSYISNETLNNFPNFAITPITKKKFKKKKTGQEITLILYHYFTNATSLNFTS